MRVTNLVGASYQMWKGLDPDADLEFLLRRYDDGVTTVAIRPVGTGDSWSPETTLIEVPA